MEKPRRYWRPWPCTTDKFTPSVLILDKIIEILKTYLHLWVRILLSFWKIIIVVAFGNKIWVTMCWSLNGGVYTQTTILIYFQAVRLEYCWCFKEHFASQCLLRIVFQLILASSSFFYFVCDAWQRLVSHVYFHLVIPVFKVYQGRCCQQGTCFLVNLLKQKQKTGEMSPPRIG